MASLYDLVDPSQMPSQMGSMDPNERAALRLRAPYRNVPVRPYNATQDFLAQSVIPQTPLDYASMFALGPAGRLASVPLRGAIMGIGGALTSDEAEAGPASKLAGLARRSAKVREAVNAELTAAEKAAPYPEAKFPQYAEQYPPTQPAGIDPTTGKPTRVLTPEAVELQKERNRIQKDMDKYGFTPFFDPAKRYDVDPANYPTPKNTLEVRPAKEDTVRKWLDQIGSVEARKRLDDAVAKGQGLGDTDRWYMMGQMEKALTDQFGEQAGRKAFVDNFVLPMATTTTGQKPRDNLILGAYANYMRDKGLPLPQSFVDTPFPVQRGKYGVGPSLRQYEKNAGGGLEALGLENPKRHDFAYDFVGHKFPVVDEQMSKGMAPDVDIKGRYGLFRQVIEEQAAKADAAQAPPTPIDPRYYQEVPWAGFGGKKGKPMIGDVNETIERTHRLTGMPRQEIFERGWGPDASRRIPLYSVGAGGVAVPSLLDLIRDRQSNTQ